MNLTNAKIGDKFFGIMATWIYRFRKGIKIVECEVVKINPKTVGIAFNKDTRRWPQLIPKGECSGLNKSMIRLAKDYKEFLKDCNFPDYLKRNIQRYLNRKIREGK